MVKNFSEYHMDLNLGEIIYVTFSLLNNCSVEAPWTQRLEIVKFEFAVFLGHIFEKEYFTPPFLSVFHVIYVMLKGLKGPTLLGFRVYR